MVAFSGGADSAFLLAAAVRALGPDRVVAATAVSPSLPASELDQAAEFARGLGVRHLTPATDEMSRPAYAANGPDRCFHCKAELLDVLVPTAAGLGIETVATGTNADDARDGFRPGIRAAALAGAVTPLRDAGSHQGAGPRGVAGLGPGHGRQAGGGLPLQPGGLRHPDQPDAAWAGSSAPRAHCGPPWSKRVSPSATFGCATSATGPASRWILSWSTSSDAGPSCSPG